MNKFAKVITIGVLSTAVIGAGVATASGWEGCQRGEYGQGKHAMMMKHRMGGKGMQRDLELTADQVRTLAEARLIMRGNDRLKVGEVREQGDDFIVQIVTVDGSLVREIEVDKDDGFPRGRRHF